MDLLNYLINYFSDKWHFLIAFLIAWWGVYSSRQIARKKNSTDILLSARQDPNYYDGLSTIAEFHNSDDKNLHKLAKAGRDDQDGKNIRYVLNQWEHISVGIQNKIYCEKILKQASCNTVIKLYRRTKIFIDSVNKEIQDNPTYYQEFKWLAKRWQEDRLTKKKKKKFIFF